MNQAFLEYYRCPAESANFRRSEGSPSGTPGYFHFGSDLTCYGTSSIQSQENAADDLADSLDQVRHEGSSCILPFDPTEIAENFRRERYVKAAPKKGWGAVARKAYYFLRPALPVSVRRHFQRSWLKGRSRLQFPGWPVDTSLDRMFERLMQLSLQGSRRERIPFIWFWPEGKSGCAIMTHDVETASGLTFTKELMNMTEAAGMRSSFQIIPAARYVATDSVLDQIRSRGFEVNVHDLKHDGHLYDDHDRFLQSASQINESVVRFGSKGFRSGALYRNVEWYEAYRFAYDMSVPNIGHLDPQPGGCCTVMPYFIGDIVELPLTTTQDYSLFHIIGTYSLDLWEEQIKRIMRQHGMMSFIVHPDYLDTARARTTYMALLQRLAALRSESNVWIALPGEVDRWWRQRSRMKIVPSEDGWRIEGPGSERARLAFAIPGNGRVEYVVN